MAPRLKIALLWAVFGFVVSAVVFLAAIFRSTSSTAAIGILFIPVYTAPFALLFFIFGYCLSDLIGWLKGGEEKLSALMKLRAVFSVILSVCGVLYLVYGILLTSAVQQVRAFNEFELNQFLESSSFKNDKYALGAFALNSNASSSLLNRVALIPNPELHQRMGSVWPVMEGNRKGFAVMRLVAMHKNISAETLVILSKSPDDYVLSTVAANPKIPVSIIRKLFEKDDYLTQWGLAVNTSAPADILRSLAEADNKYTRSSVARNISTPVRTLRALAKDPVWHVRRDVAFNPRTPIEILESLADDPDERVQAQAVRKLLKKKSSGA